MAGSLSDFFSGIAGTITGALASTIASGEDVATEIGQLASQAFSSLYNSLAASDISSNSPQASAAAAALEKSFGDAQTAVQNAYLNSSPGTYVQNAIAGVQGALSSNLGLNANGTAATPGTTPGQAPPTSPDNSSIIGSIETFIQGLETSLQGFFQPLIDEVTTTIPQAWTNFINVTLYNKWAGIYNWIVTTWWNPAATWWGSKRSNLLYNIFGIGQEPQGGSWQGRFQGPLSFNQVGDVDAYVATVNQIITKPVGFLEWIFAIPIKASIAISSAAAALSPFLSLISQRANAANPVETLPVSALIDAQYKSLVTQETAALAAASQGVSAADYQISYSAAGLTPSPDVAAQWLARKLISQDAFNLICAQNRASAAQAALIQSNAVRPVTPSDAVATSSRSAAAASGFLSASLNSVPPNSVLDLYAANQLDPIQAGYDWSVHWVIPPPQFFAQAFFRGLLPASDIALSALAANYPVELTGLFEEMSRPIIPVRIATTLLAKAVIDESQAVAIYTKAGFSATDVQTLVSYAKGISKIDPNASTTSLAKLAIASANGLFDDGTINAGQLSAIYVAHGYSADAAALEVEFIQLKQAGVQRRAEAEFQVDEVANGVTTVAAAVNWLQQNGYTAQEVQKYEKQMRKAKASKVKQPTVADITAMYKAGLIDETGVATYYVSQNYDPQYAPLLVQLAINKATAKPSTTTPPAATPQATG